ncbi:MAG: efflux RND transporter periplasmic adaptor subunit, partial [Myxococcota bacterium]
MQRPYGFVWLAALFAASCAKDEPQEPPTRLIAWAEVESADLAPTRRLSGVVVSASNATLAFEVPGKLAEVRVDTGDAFEEGAVLASLDRANFLLVAKQRRANLVAAEAAFQRALADFERHESLVSTGAVTQSRYESAKAEYESTQAQVAVAQAALDLAGKSLSDTRLLAPFAGTVTARHRDPAEQVSSRTPVVSIARSDSTTEIEVDVPETVISHLRVGTTHRVRLPALEEDALDARVTLIGSEASSSASFPVTLEFETPTESVRA